MKSKSLWTAVLLGLLVAVWTGVPAASLHAQKIQNDSDEKLNAFLPDDEEKVLVLVYCTVCHSAAATQERIASRAGGDQEFWTNLVRRMITVWNAQIPEEDVDPIAAYLTKHFGPAAARQGQQAETKEKEEAEKKP